MYNNYIISVLIPAYNEEAYIEETLTALVSGPDYIDEIITINDGSSDKTEEIITKFPVKNITLPFNRGKGYAVEQGIKSSNGDILVIIDADLGWSVQEITKIIIPVAEGEFDASIGVVPIIGGGIGLVRKFAELGMKYKTGHRMRAPLSGQRVFKKIILNELMPLEKGFGLEMGLNIAMIRKAVNYTEIECDFQHRVTGRDISGYLHRYRQLLDIFRTIRNIKGIKNV